ncbi:MAG: acyl-CoA synthetase [Paracoccaceae bacterium]|jgi:acyl-CoA synthetase
MSLSQQVLTNAQTRGESAAFIEPGWQISWLGYERASNALARRMLDVGLKRGERIGVYLPDGIALHVALMAAEKAGLIALGIGARAGLREVEHLLKVAQASALLSLPQYRDQDMTQAFKRLSESIGTLRTHVPLPLADVQGSADAVGVSTERLSKEGLSDDELFLLNSTSGTTGMPKCVAHNQTRWYAFHREAVAAADLNDKDVFLGAAPPPFGFGLWTTHITPTLLGAPTVKLPAFSAEQALQLIAEHRVSIISAVSTQFVMMLNSPSMQSADLSSLRAMFTGGERVPYQRAVDFENRSGAAVLQFYGSNETGAFTNTTLRDPQEKRLTTAGRILQSMDVRLIDDQGLDVTASGFGRPAGKGPLLSRGYYNDDAANKSLYTDDGYMLMEDLVSIDSEGYVQVAGRKGDFIIRGGKNISCAAVEEAVSAHPNIAIAAAVAVPDEVFGERVMLFVVTRDGKEISLASLAENLANRKVSRELTPEYVLICDELPRSSGGKIAKGELRKRAEDHVRSLVENEKLQKGV